jgi:regulator of sigma D
MDARLATQESVDSLPPPVHARHTREACELLVSKWRLQRIEIRRLLLQVLSGELLTFPPAEQLVSLRALCAELVDYVSTGHFEIYGRILPRKLRADPETHALLQHIFHSIGKSTDAVLGFNDRLQQQDAVPPGASFRQGLVRLSRGLLLRFALEEQLLELCGH